MCNTCGQSRIFSRFREYAAVHHVSNRLTGLHCPPTCLTERLCIQQSIYLTNILTVALAGLFKTCQTNFGFKLDDLDCYINPIAGLLTSKSP